MTTILCIDDDRETLELRRRVLESSGYKVLTAQGGADGLRMLSGGTRVDLVVLDYLMPGMNGDRVAEDIKAEFPSLPVIAMSAVQLPEKMLETVDEYVRKGQDVEALLTAISKTFAPATAMTQPGRLAGKTVLCADDDTSQLTARRMMLETAGVKVLLAHNGAEALDIFRTAPVDAAVVDYYMPGKNGLSIGAEMKRLRPDVPVIVLSGFASLPGETVGLVDAWLQKRDVELLLRELEKAVEQRRDRHPSV